MAQSTTLYSFTVASISNNNPDSGDTITVDIDGCGGGSQSFSIAPQSHENVSDPNVLPNGGEVTFTLHLPAGTPEIKVKNSDNSPDGITVSFNGGPFGQQAFVDYPGSDGTKIMLEIPFFGKQAAGGILVIGTVEDFPEV